MRGAEKGLFGGQRLGIVRGFVGVSVGAGIAWAVALWAVGYAAPAVLATVGGIFFVEGAGFVFRGTVVVIAGTATTTKVAIGLAVKVAKCGVKAAMGGDDMVNAVFMLLFFFIVIVVAGNGRNQGRSATGDGVRCQGEGIGIPAAQRIEKKVTADGEGAGGGVVSAEGKDGVGIVVTTDAAGAVPTDIGEGEAGALYGGGDKGKAAREGWIVGVIV